MRWIYGVVVLGAVGCTPAPFTSPLDGGAPWRELRSKHFLVDTDSSSGRARDLLTELERSLDLLQNVAFAYQPPLELQLRVVAIDGLIDLRQLDQPNVRGEFLSSDDGFVRRPIVVLANGTDHVDSELLLHELTHRFIAYYFQDPPIWLNEGLAEYFSTLKVVQGNALLGEYLSDRTFTDDSWGFATADGQPYLGVPIAVVPSAAALRGMTASEFYTQEDNEDARLALIARYSGSWALVHTLSLERNGHVRLKRYLDDLFYANRSEPEAWRAQFSDISEAQLQTDFVHFMHGHTTDVLRFPLRALSVPEPQERELTPSEVHTLWAEIRLPSDPKIDRDVQRAIQADPRNPEAYLQRSFRTELKHGDWSLVASDVNQAYELAPSNPRYVLAKALLERNISRHVKRHSAEELAKIWAARLARVATGTPELTFLAYDALDRDRLDAADAYAGKAIRADPSSSYAYIACARVAAARNDYRTAATRLRTALNLLADQGPNRQLQNELQSYQARAAKPSTPTPDAKPPVDD